MPEIAKLTLIAVAVLLVKHCIADYFLQTAYQYKNKGRYLHPGGLLHSGIHAALTLPVFLVLAPESREAAALIVGAEFVVHYHVDWLKEQVNWAGGYSPSASAFWRTLGVDQLAHGLTYVAIVWALLTPGLADAVLALVR